jgi:hypothetical protein
MSFDPRLKYNYKSPSVARTYSRRKSDVRHDVVKYVTRTDRKDV